MDTLHIMGLPADQTALNPVTQLIDGMAAQDIELIKSVVKTDALDAPENSVTGFVNQVVRKRFTVTPTLVGKLIKNRATVRAILTHPEKQDWGQALWFLVEKSEGEWRIAGVSKSRPMVGLFLQGVYSVTMTVEDLDQDPGLTAWGETLSESDIAEMATRLGRGMPKALLEIPMEVTSGHSLQERGILFLQERNAEASSSRSKACIVVEQAGDGSWTPTQVKPRISLESFVAGMDIPWAPTEEEEHNG